MQTNKTMDKIIKMMNVQKAQIILKKQESQKPQKLQKLQKIQEAQLSDARKTRGRFAVPLVAALLLAIFVTGCTGTNTPSSLSQSSSSASAKPSPTKSVAYENRTLIRIATLKGPTGMGMVKLLADNEAKTTANRYQPLIVGTPDEIVGKISSGEIDIAAVPTNLAATLYNKTSGKVQLLALNTLGVLNILEKGETVKSMADLKGKTLYASGKGSTPEFILNYLLMQNGIDPAKDLTIIYKTEHAELATLALSGSANLVLLPEPFVTTVLIKNNGFKSVIDLTEEWSVTTKKTGVKDSILSMGCVIVRKEFAEKEKEAVNAFLSEYAASIRFVNNSLDEASTLIAKYGIMASSALAKVAIPNCNIVYVDGESMKAQIANLYNVFFMADPKSIGGKLPEDDFYYRK